jgi:Flp pilus assembly protein TadD
MPNLARLWVLVSLAGLTGCSTLIPGYGDSGALEYRRKMQVQLERASFSSFEAPENAPTAEALIAEGDQNLEDGDRRLALLNYLEARRASPNDPRALNRIGYYYVIEDPEQAAAIFASVINRHEDSAAAHAGLGLARFAEGRYDEARASFERAEQIDGNLPAALDALGVMHAIDNDPSADPDAGLEFAQRAFRASPRDASIANNLGVAYLEKSKFRRAEEIFRSAILLDPSAPVLYNNLGYTMGRLGRYQEAATAFRRYGDDGAVHNNLGYVYYLNGDIEGAIRHFEIAIRSVEPSERIRVLRNLRAATRLGPEVSP